MLSEYRVTDRGTFPRGFAVLDKRGALVDAFRTKSGAEYAARVLGTDRATLDHHATFGCRVVER
jgi:hypothetical protein